MATAVVELGAEGAEALAPEAEALAPKAEELGSKAVSKIERLFGKKAATEAAEVGTEEAASKEAVSAAEKPAGRQTNNRLKDVTTGVVIGLSLQDSDSGSKAAQGATQTLAAVQAPPGAAFAPPAAATGAAERRRDARGRFVRGGKNDDDDDDDDGDDGDDDGDDDVGTIFANKYNLTPACAAKRGSGQPRRLHRGGFDLGDDDGLAADADFAAETQDSTSYFSTPAATGGAAEAPPTVVVHNQPRPLAESFQIAILIVLVIIVIAATITISVKKPRSLTSFGYGMLLGAVSGATVYWVLGSRSGRPKSA